MHEMTALAGMRGFRDPGKLFAATNQLRTRGTGNLLAAAAVAGTRRVIAQSYAGAGPDERAGPVKTDDDPPQWRTIRPAMQGPAAIAQVEKAVPARAREGLVRCGGLYGPGTGDFLVDAVRKRQVPVIGGGTGVWSFTEITDAAAAALAAAGRGTPGVCNVVDGDPAPAAGWLPCLAEILGAEPPRRVPGWPGRLLAGGFVVAQMTSSRGYPNERAKNELGWEPRYDSWREGFRAWVSG